jgi:outer membrane protein assembly factor BamB
MWPHVLPQSCASIHCGASFGSNRHPTFVAIAKRHLCWPLLLFIASLSSSFAQQSFTTSRADNARDGANTSETLLTPADVNKNGFGHLFSAPVDYVVMAQPLYMPNVSISGQGTHNVVYIATQADSVYAIDADTGAQLWYTSVLDGGSTASVSAHTLPCGTAQGFTQEGVVGTPVIDPNTTPNPTMYLVAKTVVDGTVQHHLHALDITTGLDEVGSPVLIAATSISNKGHVTVFNSLHQKNRPGLLLLNGVLYLGFGSNGCNDDNSGWVLSYNEATLTQVAVYNTSPDYGFTSIWQAGVGLAADEEGNIFLETAESGAHGYDVPNGGQTYCNSVVKIDPSLIENNQYELADYFTPWYVAFLDDNDMDISSTGALILPDQDGTYPHELIAGGKQGIIYVLDRDNLGMYSPTNDKQIIQELPMFSNIVGDSTTAQIQFGSPAYWNNTVYYAPNANPLMAFPLSGGMLGTPRSTGKYVGSHSPSISASGNNPQSGIMWVISGPELVAFNATTLQLLYGTGQAPNGRDKLPAVGHFVTQTVINGKVYVATLNSLEAYGLFDVASITSGKSQSATAGTALSTPIQVQVANPYNGQPDIGITVNFSDGCTKTGGTACGTFNPASAVTNSNGNVSTTYTVPEKAGTYTLTISGTGFGNATTTATARPAAAIKIIAYGGAKQTGPAGSTLPNAIVAQAQDIYKNGVSGVTITFIANNGGVANPSVVVTGASGLADTYLTLPQTVGTVTVTASSAGFKNVNFAEYSVAAATVRAPVSKSASSETQ